jgi:hypothetical protein
MKTTILLMFSFIFITGFLFGQKDTINYIESDIKGKVIQTKPIKPLLRKDDFNLPQINKNPTFRDLDRFKLFQDSLLFKDKNARLYSDYVVVEKFAGASRYYAKRPNLISSQYAKSFIIKPDTTVKQYLIIIDPRLHTMIK